MLKNKLLPTYVKLVAASSRCQTNTASQKNDHHHQNQQKQTPIRFNEVGIQMVNEELRKFLFGPKMPTSVESIVKSKTHLIEQGLLKEGPKREDSSTLADIDLSSLKLPPLKGLNIEQHFVNIARSQTHQYLKLMSLFVQNGLPDMPKRFDFSPGWTKYDTRSNKVSRVEYPDEQVLVFDVETLVKQNMCPVIAVCVSNDAWYSWCSERLVTNNFVNVGPDLSDMIPLEDAADATRRRTTKRVVIGHNVGFDRSFVKEQYFKEKSGLRFMDTMSMHIASSGFSHDQRGAVLNQENEDHQHDQPPVDRVLSAWRAVGSLNNLADVHRHYVPTGQELNKDSRNTFVKGTAQDVIDNFQELVLYCANDVKATYEVFRELMPIFLERFPSPVTLSGMLEMSTMYMPINQNWFKYISNCENTFNDCDYELKKLLERSAYDACRYLDHKDSDHWLKNLDWSTVEFKCKPKSKKAAKESTRDVVAEINPLVKISDNRVKSQIKENASQWNKCVSERVERLLDPSEHSMAKNMYMCNYPSWFRDLCPTPTEERPWQPVPSEVTTRIRVMPNLLRLTWQDKPLHFLKDHGWGFYEPIIEENKQSNNKKKIKKELDVQEIDGQQYRFVKIPHKDGDKMNVGNPLSKSFLGKIQEGVLGSIPAEFAKLAVKNHNIISYWANNLKRIQAQKAVIIEKKSDEECLGAILPTTVVAGTITRRAVEPTWLTATNYSKDRIGCELKTMIQSPPGYCIVGADVDSQELWIAATIGDAHFAQMPGSTALGWMNLEGKKSDGTDMHSKTARIIGISRDHAKVFNYGRIYGAGVTFAVKLLMQFNPKLSEQEAHEKARELYAQTKGTKKKGGGKKWHGGSESEMFNKLEEIATTFPSTPVLNARITKALEPENVSTNYMTSRINWVVQSSAVDYLHLMLCCMNWLIDEYNIDARFLLSIHDEVRYLVKEEDKYRLALALQITNLFTRVMFSYKLDLNDLPMSVAFFSAVDIDTCLRKEPDLDFVSPSNPNGLSKGYNIPPGKCVDIYDIIKKTSGSLD